MNTPPFSNTTTPFALTVWRTGAGAWAVSITGADTECATLAPTIEQALTKLSDDLQYIVLRRVNRLVALEAGGENE